MSKNKFSKGFGIILMIVLAVIGITGCSSPEQTKDKKQTPIINNTNEPSITIAPTTSTIVTSNNSSIPSFSSSPKQTIADSNDPVIETNENIKRSDMDKFFEFVYYRLYKSGKLELKVVHVAAYEDRDKIFPLDKIYKEVENLGSVKKVYVGSLTGYNDNGIDVVFIMKDGTVEQLKYIFDKTLRSVGKIKGFENCVDFKENEGYLSIIQKDGTSKDFVVGMNSQTN